MAGISRPSQEYVEERFKERGYKLLDNYINCYTAMKFIVSVVKPPALAGGYKTPT